MEDDVLRRTLAELNRRGRALAEERCAWLDEGLRFGLVTAEESPVYASPTDLAYLASRLYRAGSLPLPDGIVSAPLPPCPPSVSCMAGHLYEKALARFFPDRTETRLVRDAFADVVDDVYSQRTSYALLPIENTDHGKLRNFYAMILNYNLKLLKVCDVEHDDTSSTRLALVGQGPLSLAAGTEPRQFECSITSESPSFLTDLVSVAAKVGLSVVRLDSVPFSHLRHAYSYYVSLAVPRQEALCDFLAYLTYTGVSLTPIGYYTLH